MAAYHQSRSHAMPSQMSQLTNILGWICTAKDNLPALNDGAVDADRMAALSGLLDRMHRLAVTLAATQGRRAAPERLRDDQRRAA
jgi:hypothetical protein